MIKKHYIPDNWVQSHLDEIIVRVTNGCSNKQTEETDGLPISRIETISFENIDWSKVKYILDYDNELIEKYKLLQGDILFSHINSDLHLGKTAMFKDKNKLLIHGINLLLIRPSILINSSFLNFYFNFARYRGDFIDMAQRAVNQSSINQKKLKSLSIPLPPLNEQKRIVAKIEELFSELDNAVENLKKVQKQLKVYRQAVLKAAFEGNFTKANSDTESDNLNGWRLVPLSELIEEPRYGTSKKCSYDTEGIGVLRIPNLCDYRIDDSDLKKAQFTNDEIETYKLEKGDLLIIRSNGSISLVGKTSIVSEKEVDYMFAGYLIRLRCLKSMLNSKFMLYCLSSHQLRVQIESKAKSTSGVNNINAKEIKSLLVPVCSLKEQGKVVEEIESRLSIYDDLEKTIEQSLTLEQLLRQSILKKAFEGKLVPQDSNDEPAEALLERIKREKEGLVKEIKPRSIKLKKEMVKV